MDFGGSGDINIGVGGDISPLKQALDQIPALARQAGEAAATALSSAASGGGVASGAFQDAAKATQQLSDAMNTAVGAAAALDKELQQKPTDAGAAAQSFQDLGTQLRDAGSAMVLIGGVLTGISAGLIELGESSLMAAGKMEQQRTAMVNLTKSAEQTDRLIKDLVEFAIKTPFEIPGVIEMGQKLVAMGTATQDVIPLLRTLGDTASGSGKGFAGLNVLVQDFGKMSQLGVIHMRELNTLAYQGVPAIQALADAFGVSTHRMRQMVEQNLIQASDALPILTKAMSDKFGGMMEAQSKTLLGMWSNFKDSITKTFIAIGDALIPAFKGIINAIQPLLDTIQQIAQWFGKLPEPVQSAVVAIGLLVIAIGPLVLAAGGFLFVAGQIITTLPALAATVGVELPAAFTRGTIAVVANTEALAANAIAARAAGTALSTTVVEGAGAAAVAIGALKTAVSIAIPILGALATAFVAGKLIASILETIPYVKQLQQAWADQAMAQTGAVSGAMAQGSVAYFKTLGESARGASAGLDLAATGLRNLQTAQADANQAVKVAKDVMDAAKKALDGSADAAAVYARAVNAYDDAVKKANPSVATSAKNVDMQAMAMQTTGLAIEKYIKLWSTIPWEVWTGSVAEASAAIKEKGLSIDKTVAALKKMADSLEGPASTSAALKAQYDEILANINVLEGLKRAIDGANTATGGWIKTVENGVEVWRQASAAVSGFTTTIENGVTMIRGSKEAVVDYTGATEKLGKASESQQQQLDHSSGKLVTHEQSLKRVSSQVESTAHVVSMASDKMKGSFMEGMNGMTVSGETFIAMLAQMGALSSQISLAARALGYEEIGINNFVSPEFKAAYQQKGTESLNALGLLDILQAFEKHWQEKAEADARALDAHTAAVEAATHKYDDLLITVNGMIMTVKEYNELGKKITDSIVNPLNDVGEAATGAANGLSQVGGLSNAFSDATHSTQEWSDFIQDHADLLPQIQGTIQSALVKAGVNFYDAADMAGRLAQGLDAAADVVTNAVVRIGESVGSGPQKFVSTVEPGRSFSNEDAQKAFDEYQAKINADYKAMMERSAEAQRVTGLMASGQTSGLSGIVRDVYGTMYDFSQQVNGMVAVLTPNNLGGMTTQWVQLRQSAAQLAEAQRKYEAEMEQARLARNAASVLEQKRLQELSNAYTDAVYSFGRNSEIMTYEAYSLLTFAQQQARNANNPLNDPRFSDLFPQPRYGYGVNGTGMMYGSSASGSVNPSFNPGMLAQSGGGVNVYVTGNNIMDQGTVNNLTNRIATQMTQILRTNAGLKV